LVVNVTSAAMASGRVGTANHCFENGVKTLEMVPALVSTVPGAWTRVPQCHSTGTSTA